MVSWALRGPSNTHFMCPCVPERGIYKVVGVASPDSPSGSLMCPLRPYLVCSSTGLNHAISSAERERDGGRDGGRTRALPLLPSHTSVEEHVPDDGRPPVDFVRVPAQDHALAYHPTRVHLVECSHGNQYMNAYRMVTVNLATIVMDIKWCYILPLRSGLKTSVG